MFAIAVLDFTLYIIISPLCASSTFTILQHPILRVFLRKTRQIGLRTCHLASSRQSHTMFLPYLPDYSGPHKVGATEVEIPSSEISASGSSTIETIKFRIFYPTNPKPSSRPNSNLYWLPDPQKEWTEAYASFMGASSGWKALMTTSVLSVLKYVKLPVMKDTSLLCPAQTTAHGLPVCIFSHGLGGSFNSYSSIVGTLASHGVICIVPEHRDGSAPIAFIRNSKGHNSRSVSYEKVSHSPTTSVLNARNKQLRTRLWELEKIYTVVKGLNEGRTFSNFAAITSETDSQSWKRIQEELCGHMDLRPGRVTWAGHSFGAATTTQLVKFVFYHQDIPAAPLEKRKSGDDEWDWTPLATYDSRDAVVEQITPDSPVVLLDLWTMPLRGDPTKWLFDKPMPCYSREGDVSATSPNTLAVMSAEFYKWTDLLNRTRSLLSPDPAHNTDRKSAERLSLPEEDTVRATNPIPELSKQTGEPTSSFSSRSPSPTQNDSHPVSSSSSTTSLSQASTLHSDADPKEPHLYLVTQSAHLSQSDFGVLFPNLTKYVMKAIEPEKTLHLNLRAILAMMKGQGLPVENVNGVKEDEIFASQTNSKVRKEQRWIRVPLDGEVEQI